MSMSVDPRARAQFGSALIIIQKNSSGNQTMVYLIRFIASCLAMYCYERGRPTLSDRPQVGQNRLAFRSHCEPLHARLDLS
jgi:hypothetical protein